MDIRVLTDTYAVSPQIAPEDCPAIAEAGYGTIICNRPDAEIPSNLQASEMKSAAEAAGLTFHILPITHQTMNAQNISAHAEIIASSDKPVLAYCASGTRSTIIWALGQAGEKSGDDIIATAANAGYDLSGLRGALGA